MKSRTIITGTLLVSSLIAAPAAVMAGGPAGTGGGDMDQIHAVQQDMVRTRDRVHDQSVATTQTRARVHAQDRAAARTATKSQARSGRRNGQ